MTTSMTTTCGITEQARRSDGAVLVYACDRESGHSGEHAGGLLAPRGDGSTMAWNVRCDVIVNNGMGEPTECGMTWPCEYHDG